jgi:hypothetical protein
MEELTWQETRGKVFRFQENAVYPIAVIQYIRHSAA